MDLVGRQDRLLLLGLVLALLVAFAHPLARLLDAAGDAQRNAGVALVPALIVLLVVLAIHEFAKRQESRAVAEANEAQAREAQERANEMERLAALGQALNRSAALDAIRDVLHHQLYALAASDRAWVMVRNGRAWQMLAGSPRVPQRDIEAMCEQIAARQQMAPLRTGRHGALAIDGHLCFPMTGSGQVIAVLGVPADSAIPNSRRRRLAAAASLLGIALRNLELVHEMREHSVRDRLTGCATRVHGLDVIASELRRARRSQAPLSLVMFDLDYFARINERWGDQAGDAVLAAVGARLRALLRGSDLKCRYGGESFLVLLPDTPLDGAQRVADSLRRQIATVPVFWRGEAIRVTASFGVTTALPAETEADALVARADAALYRAKDHGRNCVRLSIEAAVA